MIKNSSIIIGKMVVTPMPVLSPICSAVIPIFAALSIKSGMVKTRSETVPHSHEPSEQPASPNSARIPNIAVPLFLSILAEYEYTPGHIILTEKPVTAQASRAMYAFWDTAAVK